MVHQCVTGIEDLFHRLVAVTLLALGDEVARKHQVIEDALGVGPGAEQVVALENELWPYEACAITSACIVIVFSSIR